MLKVLPSVSFNCVVTEAFKPMYNQYFYPAFKNSRVVLNVFGNNSARNVEWGDHNFLDSIHFKIWKVIESLHSYKFAIWSDVDIIFLTEPKLILNDLLRIIKFYDIAFSPETRYPNNINSGFFIVRSNERTITLFRHLLEKIQQRRSTEQYIMQDLLMGGYAGIKWKLLPIAYWNLTVGFPIPKDIKIAHANCILQDRGLGLFRGNTHIEKKMDALFKLKQRLQITPV
jgi:hypothetical protein